MKDRAEAAAPARPLPPGWTRSLRVLTWSFFVLVAGFVVHYARGVHWHEVWSAIRATPWQVLAGAVGLAMLSFTLCSAYDLLGRHYTGHTLAKRRVMKIGFIAYAFNLNLGSLVGSVAMRLRLYSRSGLDLPTITRVMTLSMLSNWLGYLLLAGLVFSFVPLALPPHWTIDDTQLHVAGALLLALAGAYVALCLWSPKRSFELRGYEVLLPPRRMVPVQLAMSCANWMTMAAIVWVLMRGQLPYFTVLNVLLLGAVAGVITHVPAGLGVLEAVFLALLSHQMPPWQLLAALLSYRAIYYIGPLLIAAGLYLWLEARARAQGRHRRMRAIKRKL